MIDHLPSLTPGTTRVARTLVRCHDKLNRRRADARASGRYALERNALLGFGAIYLSSLALIAVQVLIAH